MQSRRNCGEYWVFSEIKRIAASLLRDSREGKTITRASKTTLLRQRPQFAKTFAYGKRVNFLSLNNM
ncbi:MAG TPA: hypothetical protein H9731_07790 [Candidatus Borkfalkia excrementipullorum]|nr:hypothetical protein [Candidatus Borkfalkia excrementipullorum]